MSAPDALRLGRRHAPAHFLSRLPAKRVIVGYTLSAVTGAVACASICIVALLGFVNVALGCTLSWQGPACLVWRFIFERVIGGPRDVARCTVVAARFVLIAAFAYVTIDVDNLIDRSGRVEIAVVTIVIILVIFVLSHAPAGTVRVEDPLRVHVLGVDWPGLLAFSAVNVSTEVLRERCTVIAVMEFSWLWSWLYFGIASAHGKWVVSWWLYPGLSWP